MQKFPSWIKLMWARRVLVGCVLLLVAGGVASADTTYIYIGQAFNSAGCLFGVFCGPAPVGSGPITLSFTEATPLPANLTGPIYGIMADLTTLVGLTPTSFTISDGLNTFTGVNSFSNFFVETDSSGNIIAWNIGYNIPGVYGENTINSTGATPGNPVTVQDGAASFCFSLQCETVHFVNNQAGTWTVQGATATPEPASLVLVATGFMAFAALRRKRAS